MEFHLIPHCRLAAAALLVVLFTPLAVSAQDVESADDPFPAVVAEERAAAPEEGMTPASLFRENPAAVFWSVLPFLIASLIAIWFGVERTVVLRRGRVIPKPFVERFLNLLRAGQLDPHSALELCEQNGSPVANIFAYGVRKWGKPSVEVEQAIIDGGERQVAQLRKHLRIINGVATITPLIGLLGTVLGMMIAFFDLAGSGGGNRAQELAVGIVTALSTTAIGLAIAIPCLILYMYLAGRIDGLVMEMDELAQQVVNLISAEGLASNPPVRPSPRSRIKAAETI
ncbi:MAG: MotA/TolQ/ExbB proton channel family protein [Planctomycetaceae bacterium]|nr:MotA/TolQ/ExbB proton channel family protein [Planctomycetaceae bacterium]